MQIHPDRYTAIHCHPLPSTAIHCHPLRATEIYRYPLRYAEYYHQPTEYCHTSKTLIESTDTVPSLPIRCIISLNAEELCPLIRSGVLRGAHGMDRFKARKDTVTTQICHYFDQISHKCAEIPVYTVVYGPFHYHSGISPPLGTLFIFPPFGHITFASL